MDIEPVDAPLPYNVGVFGAGSALANGVYVRLSADSNVGKGRVIYENLGGYTLQPVKTSEEERRARKDAPLWIWSIMREDFTVYAAAAEGRTKIPALNWQKLKGETPAPPEVEALEDTADCVAAAYAREAQFIAPAADPQRALEVYHRALEGGQILEANWGKRAELRAGRGKVRQHLDRFDEALGDVDVALALKPDFLPALLLRAQLLQETGELTDSALSAKRCWLICEDRLGDSQIGAETRGFLERLRGDCQELLEGLGERPDASLPSGYGAPENSDDEEPGGDSESAPQQQERTIGARVTGAGLEGVDGVYAPTGQKSNSEDVYTNAVGFKLSLEVLPMKSSGEVRYGWIIGREGMGCYGARTDKATRKPPRDGWRCFPNGVAPAPSCAVKSVFSDPLAALGSDKLASGDSKEAIAALQKALMHPRVAGDMRQRCRVLTDLSAAFRASGDFVTARRRADEAVAVGPASEDAYLELARVQTDAGDAAGAARSLQQLLTMQPSSDRAARMLLELAQRVPAVRQWLKWHHEIDKRGLATASSTNEEREEDIRVEMTRRLKQIYMRRAPHRFEDRGEDAEVHACWELPDGIVASDIRVDIQVQSLLVQVRDVTIFALPLDHPVKPSESTWNFDEPELNVVLGKSMGNQVWNQLRYMTQEEFDDQEAAIRAMKKRVQGIC